MHNQGVGGWTNELTMQNYADMKDAISSKIIKKNEEARNANDVDAIKLPLTNILRIMSCYAIPRYYLRICREYK